MTLRAATKIIRTAVYDDRTCNADTLRRAVARMKTGRIVSRRYNSTAAAGIMAALMQFGWTPGRIRLWVEGQAACRKIENGGRSLPRRPLANLRGRTCPPAPLAGIGPLWEGTAR